MGKSGNVHEIKLTVYRNVIIILGNLGIHISYINIFSWNSNVQAIFEDWMSHICSVFGFLRFDCDIVNPQIDALS